jgi:hypothetical protein
MIRGTTAWRNRNLIWRMLHTVVMAQLPPYSLVGAVCPPYLYFRALNRFVGRGCKLCFEGVSLDSDIDFCVADKGKSSPLFV